MQVVVLGTSHQTASVDVREKLGFTERQLIPALGRLLERQGAMEAVILSTCNRTELYLVTEDVDDARDTLAAFWQTEKQVEAGYLTPYTYYYAGEDALRHLHRVAAGLDSLIVGEGQIQAQVKGALSVAQQCDAAGQYLEMLFQQAIKAGKQVRTQTDLGRGSVSVSSAAVEVALEELGDLRERIVLIYGAGKMSSHTIKALLNRGANHVYIVNRTFERAQEAAKRLGGEAITMEAGRLLHAAADLVICCTSSPTYLLKPDNYPSVPGRKRLLIDIAVPRNIDPALASMPGVKVIDLDGLEAVARSNRLERANMILDAEVMIEKNLGDFSSRLASFQTVPTIQAFASRMEEVRSDEVDDFLTRHAGLLERDPREALERLSRQIVARIMHPAVVQLKGLDPDEQLGHAAALARLFELEVEDATTRYLRKRLPQREKAQQTGRLVLHGTVPQADELAGG